MSNIELYNTSIKFLLKSLNKLEQNKSVNLALINEINNKYLLMSPYNILAQPSYLLATNVNAVKPINAKEANELKETIIKIILKIKERKAARKLSLLDPEPVRIDIGATPEPVGVGIGATPEPDGRHDGRRDGRREARPDGRPDGRRDDRPDGRREARRDGRHDDRHDDRPDDRRDGLPYGRPDGRPDTMHDGLPYGRPDDRPYGIPERLEQELIMATTPELVLPPRLAPGLVLPSRLAPGLVLPTGLAPELPTRLAPELPTGLAPELPTGLAPELPTTPRLASGLVLQPPELVLPTRIAPVLPTTPILSSKLAPVLQPILTSKMELTPTAHPRDGQINTAQTNVNIITKKLSFKIYSKSFIKGCLLVINDLAIKDAQDRNTIINRARYIYNDTMFEISNESQKMSNQSYENDATRNEALIKNQNTNNAYLGFLEGTRYIRNAYIDTNNTYSADAVRKEGENALIVAKNNFKNYKSNLVTVTPRHDSLKELVNLKEAPTYDAHKILVKLEEDVVIAQNILNTVQGEYRTAAANAVTTDANARVYSNQVNGAKSIIFDGGIRDATNRDDIIRRAQAIYDNATYNVDRSNEIIRESSRPSAQSQYNLNTTLAWQKGAKSILDTYKNDTNSDSDANNVKRVGNDKYQKMADNLKIVVAAKIKALKNEMAANQAFLEAQNNLKLVTARIKS